MDTATAPRTRRVTVSARKVAYMGATYTDTLLGLTVVERTFEGEPFVGTVTGFVGEHAVITAPDGRWMRARNRDLAIVVTD